MPRPKTGDKRRAILRAATETIAEEGLGASTARIANAAAIAEGSLFRYFSNKDALLNELYLALKLDLQQSTAAGFPVAASLRKRARHIWNVYLNWGIEAPEKRKAMLQFNVSDRIAESTRLAGRAGMEDAVSVMEQLTAKGKLKGLPLTFAADLLVAMAEATIASMEMNPAAAERYRATGFEAFWSATAKK